MIPNEQWLKDAVENYKKSPKQITCKDLQAYNDLAQAYLEAGKEMPEKKPLTIKQTRVTYQVNYGYNQAIDDCTLASMKREAEWEKKLDEEKMDCILEEVFTRGFRHGVSKGLSADGEHYAVRDAKKSIREHLMGEA